MPPRQTSEIFGGLNPKTSKSPQRGIANSTHHPLHDVALAIATTGRTGVEEVDWEIFVPEPFRERISDLETIENLHRKNGSNTGSTKNISAIFQETDMYACSRMPWELR